MARVLMEHVCKYFGRVTAVADLCLEVRDKEFLVLVGPSGCGKSTTLRIMAGLEEPTCGDIYIGEAKVNQVPPRSRDVAMVFQSYALYPHMTVYDNMAFGLRLRGITREEIDRRVKHAAQVLGIGELLRRKPRELSGGQRQRVALGRAIVRVPKVFLMDEPLSNLDAKLRVQTRAELKRLHRMLETTVVYVTHDQAEAMTMANRIAVLNDGVLQQLGTPDELYNSPANLFVAGFIGSPPMNFFDARLIGEGDGLFVRGEGFNVRLPQDKTKSLATHTGKEVVLGIRPEDIGVACIPPTGRPSEPMSSTVDVVEPLGGEVFFYLVLGNKSYAARGTLANVCSPGECVQIVWSLDKIHFFDKQSDDAIPC